VRIIGDNNQVAFAVNGSGIWIQHATDLVDSGVIRNGKIRYDTMENKAWKRVRVRTINDEANGDIGVYKMNVNSDEVITTILEGNSTAADIDLANSYPKIGPDAAFKLELHKNSTDATTGPIVVGLAVKALPSPTRARVIQIPIFMFDKETDKTGNMIGYEGYARERLFALESVESIGATIIIQDFTAGGEPVECVIEQITFTRATPSARNYSGFGGICQIIARTVV
jgi:hypothetical protein